MAFHDPTGTEHDYLGAGLRKALYNYMHGIGLDADVREWFPLRADRKGGNGHSKKHGRRRHPAHSVPATTVPPDLIERCLS